MSATTGIAACLLVGGAVVALACVARPVVHWFYFRRYMRDGERDLAALRVQLDSLEHRCSGARTLVSPSGVVLDIPPRGWDASEILEILAEIESLG